MNNKYCVAKINCVSDQSGKACASVRPVGTADSHQFYRAANLTRGWPVPRGWACTPRTTNAYHEVGKIPKNDFICFESRFSFFSQSKMAGQLVVERAGRCYLTTGRKSRMTWFHTNAQLHLCPLWKILGLLLSERNAPQKSRRKKAYRIEVSYTRARYLFNACLLKRRGTSPGKPEGFFPSPRLVVPRNTLCGLQQRE